MIWSVILYTIAGLIGLFILLLLFILFTPFYLDAQGQWADDRGNGTVSLWWIHPFILTGKYSFPENDLFIKIAFWKIRKKKSQAQPSVMEETNETQPAKSVAEPVSESEEKKTEISEKVAESEYTNPETVEKKSGKIDNLLERIRNNQIVFFLRQKKWRGKIIHLLIRFLKSFRYMVRCKQLSAHIKAGVEDPAVLGKIYGYYEAVSNGIDLRNPKFNLLFEPVFMKKSFEGDGKAIIRSSIGCLLAPVGIAIFTFPYLSTFLIWYRLKRRNRKMKDEKRNKKYYRQRIHP